MAPPGRAPTATDCRHDGSAVEITAVVSVLDAGVSLRRRRTRIDPAQLPTF